MTENLAEALRRNKKPLLWGITLTAVVLLFLGGSFLSLAHNKLEKLKLSKRSVKLDQEYKQLSQLKEQLEAEDLKLIEKIARTEYHLVKPGEVEFRFTKE